VLWTRVGYAGGQRPAPTYHDLGDHSESVEVGYDPARIAYATLLTEFFAAHVPDEGEPWSHQYRSAIFVRDAAERDQAEVARRIAARRLGRPVSTAIEDAGTFWAAEDYHQKYQLRSSPAVWAALTRAYPDLDALVHSTAAARLNAWVGGYGTPTDREIDAIGLPADARAELLR
jgi:peptide-methionine (S)-S-oxide reductase